jgi:hypothetical protein
MKPPTLQILSVNLNPRCNGIKLTSAEKERGADVFIFSLLQISNFTSHVIIEEKKKNSGDFN